MAAALRRTRRLELLGASLLLGCACRSGDAPPPSPSPEDEPPLEALGPVRRPPWTLVMQRVGDRCQVRTEQTGGERRIEPELVACPRDLEPDESVRLTGRTCLRDGGPSGVTRPIGCPEELLELEERLRKRDMTPR